MKCLIVLFATVAALAGFAAGQKKIVCYYGSWAVYRPGNGKCEPENLDPSVCTHMIYTFVGITDNGDVKVLDSWNDLPDNGGKNGFARFNSLRSKNPNMKTLVAIGGWNEGSAKYSEVANNPSKRANFVNSAAEFTIKYGFDGFDLDWEYPSQRGGKPSDYDAFVTLVREMRDRFNRNGLLLTAAVGAGEATASKAYNIAEISKHLDFINLMAYDYHVSGENRAGHNAPLYGDGNDQGLNVDASVKYWLSRGAPKDKLIMGIPLYGHTFALVNQNNVQPGSATNGNGPAGPYTRQGGMIGYNEICETESKGWRRYWDDKAQVPYAVKGNTWYSYDDEQSIKLKAEYINNMGLGGAMVWSLETDDFKGVCGGKFPLMNTIKNTLKGGLSQGGSPWMPTSQPEPEPQPTSPPVMPTKPQPSSGGICKQAGDFVRSPKDCAVFYQCADNGDGTFTAYKFKCGAGLYFDETMNVCNYAANVIC